MSTEDRPTIPDRPHTVIGLPVSGPRAAALRDALEAYEARCADVKRALQVQGDDGAAYKHARELKHAQFNAVLSTVEAILAHIAVHAKE